jgi:Protein of unknown function (DUF1761)
MEINWLAVVLAALSAFPLGFVWYGPLFGKAWAAEVGMTDEKAKASNPAIVFGGAFVLQLIQASTFAMFLGQVRNPEAALYGLCAGLCWVGAAFGVQYLFERRSLRLGLINAGYNAVAFTLIGAIVGALK